MNNLSKRCFEIAKGVNFRHYKGATSVKIWREVGNTNIHVENGIPSFTKGHARNVSIKHGEAFYQQPMPKEYAKTFGWANGTPQPSIMQQAFFRALTGDRTPKH